MRHQRRTLRPPYLRRVWLNEEASYDRATYPYCLPLFRDGNFELVLDRPIAIIAGENGVGKSTLLEGIAVLAGFNESGGGPGYHAVDNSKALEIGGGELARSLKASWLPKISQGWFFRAESFFSVARYLDEMGSPSANFLSYSHGEGFIRFFEERCGRPGIFIFDEPESALSPKRQFDFLRLLSRMEAANQSQILIVTHSPIIMGYPGAQLMRMTRYGLNPVELQNTEHFQILREFVSDPDGMIRAMING